MKNRTVLILALLLCVSLISVHAEPRWWKGNTHTHSWWSDGDSPPENISAWFREHGYNFLVFSDHNIMQEGEKWYLLRSEQHQAAYKTYVDTFGEDWVVERTNDGQTEVKLKTLEEFRSKFEEPGEFIFIKGEEISDNFTGRPVHINGVNLIHLIMPRGGDSITETIQNNIFAAREQEMQTGQPMFLHLNHTNFHYAIRTEDLLEVEYEPGEGFMEIYNGHPGVRNYGNELHDGCERQWDIVLAKRLQELDKSVLYGVATDDSHEYTAWGVGNTNPGRGWIMVRAESLEPNVITSAIKAGDFYCSTGVTLKELSITDDEIQLEIEPQDGVDYTIEFVGTKTDADLEGVERETDNPKAYLSLQYSDEIGKVFHSVKGTSANYKLQDDDIYVRARVTSTKLHPNPFQEGDFEQAWTQPLVNGK